MLRGRGSAVRRLSVPTLSPAFLDIVFASVKYADRYRLLWRERTAKSTCDRGPGRFFTQLNTFTDAGVSEHAQPTSAHILSTL